MKVYFVGAGPGDPDLMTVKAQRLLKAAPYCVYAGSLVAPDILSLIPPSVQQYNSASMNLEQIIAVFVKAKEQDRDVVRLHTGEPSLYGAIGEQMTALDKLGIDYEMVPGISAFQAAAAALRKELTLPQVSQSVILTRTAGRTPMPPGEELEKMAIAGVTLCIYLSTDHIKHVTQVVANHYGAQCPMALVYHASWPDQQVIQGTADNLAAKVQEAGVKRTAIILAGPALSGQGACSKLYDRTFAHGYRDAKTVQKGELA